MILKFHQWNKLNEGSLKFDADNLNDIVIKAFKKYENFNYSFKNEFYNKFMKDENFNKNLYIHNIPDDVDYEDENFNIKNYPLIKRSDENLNSFYIKFINTLMNDIHYNSINYIVYQSILGIYDDENKILNIIKKLKFEIMNFYANFLIKIILQINEYIKPDFSKLNINEDDDTFWIFNHKFMLHIDYLKFDDYTRLSKYHGFYKKSENKIIFVINDILYTIFNENKAFKFDNYDLNLLDKEFNKYYKNIMLNLIQEILSHEFTHYLQMMFIDVPSDKIKKNNNKTKETDKLLYYYNNHLELGATITYFYNLIKSYKNNKNFDKLFNMKNLNTFIKNLDIDIKNEYIYNTNLIRYNELTSKNKNKFWKYLYDLLYNK